MPVRLRVVVLGGGFGGLELATLLSDAFGDAIDIVLIDKSDTFVFGFSKLDVMFGRQMPADVQHPYRDIVKPGVRFLQSMVRSIDPATRRVVTDNGTFEADALVVALGADLDPAATPGLVEGGNEFYTVAGQPFRKTCWETAWGSLHGGVLRCYGGRPRCRGLISRAEFWGSATRVRGLGAE